MPTGETHHYAKAPPTAIAPTMADVVRETRSTRRLLEQHLANDRADRAAASLRQDAIMGLLKEILGRLPAGT